MSAATEMETFANHSHRNQTEDNNQQLFISRFHPQRSSHALDVAAEKWDVRLFSCYPGLHTFHLINACKYS